MNKFINLLNTIKFKIKKNSNPPGKCFIIAFNLRDYLLLVHVHVQFNYASESIFHLITVFDLISAHFPISAQYDNV